MNSSFLTVFRREISAYFNAAIAYIFIIVFVLLNGGLYMTQFFVIGFADMRPFFTTLPFILAVFLPAVTMRLWAEEKRGNTLELLLTFPMGTHSLVLGKFLASLVFYLAALAGTLTLPIMLHFLGRPDAGMIFSGYLGAIFIGSFFLALGIFISGLCRDQIVAFILAMIVTFGIHLAGTEFLASSIDGWIPGFGSFLRHYIGSAEHFDAFAKGVVDTRDVLYFLIGTGIFLVLNGFWFEGRMKAGAKKIFTAATLISAIIFLVSNWFLDGLPLGRFDLTQGQMYTISPATKKILKELKAPVTAKFYVSASDKMPTGMKTLEQDIKSKLDEFRVASKGNFDYKIFHMEAANVVEKTDKQQDSLEAQLERKGIQPFQVRAIESDEVAVRLIYSSIAIAYKEKPEEILPRVMPENLSELEYMLSSKVYRMTLDTIPKIALIAPYQEKEVDPQMRALLAQLGGKVPEGYKEDNYEVLPMALEYEGYEMARIRLTKDEPIPEGTKTLVIVEPKDLNERQKYEINKFLRSGGSVFLAIQNYNYEYAPRGRSLKIFPKKENPSINSLLSAWGLEVDEEILVDQQHDVINLSGGARIGPFEMSIPVKVPIQILVNATGMNPKVSITSQLSPIFYLWGTALKLDENKVKAQSLKVETLLRSSPDSWTVPFQEGDLSPEQLRPQPSSRRGPLPLAVLVQGQFADAFEGKGIPEWPSDAKPAAEGAAAAKPAEEKKPEPAPLMSPASGKLLLTGAATFFQKNLIKSGGHLNFFMNGVDALTLGDELVTIRSKQPVDRAINRISAPAKVGWRFFVTVLMPLLLAVIGGLRVFLRRQSKQNYLKAYALNE